MAFTISWPTQYTVSGVTYYLHLYSNQNLTDSNAGMSYLVLGKSVDGDPDTTSLISMYDASATTATTEYNGSEVPDQEMTMYDDTGYHYRQYSPLRWDAAAPVTRKYEVIWPSSYEYNGIVYYLLKFRNQVDASAKYVVRTASTENSDYTSLAISTLSTLVVPTKDYNGEKVPDFEVQTFSEPTDTAQRYYSSKPFGSKPDIGEPSDRVRDASASAAVPVDYFDYTSDFATDIRAHLRNNISDCALMLEKELLGHKWTYSSSRDVTISGFPKQYQWYSTVGRVRAFNTGTYNLDAIGVYAAAICARGLAELCLYKRWSYQLLIHMCLAMRASKFDITERAEYIVTTDTAFVTGTTYYERVIDSTTGVETYEPTTDTVMDPYKTYYTYSNAFISGRTYIRSIKNSSSSADKLPATAGDPERDYYYIPVASGNVTPLSTRDEHYKLYSFDKETGTFEQYNHLYPADGTVDGNHRDNYYAFLSHYETVTDALATFKPGTTYYRKDDDSMMLMLIINNADQLREAVETYGTVYYKAYESVTVDTYGEHDIYYRRSGNEYIEVPIRNKTEFVEQLDKYKLLYRNGQFVPLYEPHTLGHPDPDNPNSFTLNGRDIYIAYGNDGMYYYELVGNAGRYRTIVPDHTKVDPYDSVENCHVWRAAMTGDTSDKLYTDKTNEYVDKIRIAVNTILLHYSRAMLILRRDPPMANVIPSSQAYTVGDLVERINAIIIAINAYADPSVGAYPIGLLPSEDYHTRLLKLKCNDIVNFIKKDAFFITACARVCDDTHGYSEFLPDNSMFIYDLLKDRTVNLDKLIKYNITSDTEFITGKTYYEYLRYIVSTDTVKDPNKEYYERTNEPDYWVTHDTVRKPDKQYYEDIDPTYVRTTDGMWDHTKTYYELIPAEYKETTDTTLDPSKTYYEYTEYTKVKPDSMYDNTYYEYETPSCVPTKDATPIRGKQYYVHVGQTCTKVSVRHFDPDLVYYEHVGGGYKKSVDTIPYESKTYYKYTGPAYIKSTDTVPGEFKTYYERIPESYVKSNDGKFNSDTEYYEFVTKKLSTDNPLKSDKTYYEYTQFPATSDVELDPNKTYYERASGDFLVTTDKIMVAGKHYYEKVELAYTVDYNDLGFYYDPTDKARMKTFDKLDWSGVQQDPAEGIIHLSDQNVPYVYSKTKDGELIDVPLNTVIDVRRLAHTWHNCDYNGCMQVIKLTGRDLTVTDENGVPWYRYLADVVATDENGNNLSEKVLNNVKELTEYINTLLKVAPIAADYMIDIFRRTMEYIPSMADKLNYSRTGVVSRI